MKRWMLALLVAVFALTAVGCNNDKDKDRDDDDGASLKIDVDD